MSVLDDTISERQFHGPARLLHEQMRASSLNSNPAIIGYISMREWLTTSYGKEGIGWDAFSDRYEEAQELALGISEDIRGGAIVPLAMIDIVVYPDGDIYHHLKYS